MRIATILSSAALAAVCLPDLAAQGRDSAPLTAGNRAFCADLHRILAAGHAGEDVAFSPLSIRTALAMLRAGATGETREQIDSGAHFTLPDARLAAAFTERLAAIRPPVREDSPADFELEIANAAWVRTGFQLRDGYARRIRTGFDAAIDELDFGADLEASRRTINTWVERHTAGRVQHLIGEGLLSERTRVVLTNAVWFRAPWSARLWLEPASRPFHAPGGEVECTFVGGHAVLRHARVDGTTIVELPYRGGRFVMVFVLPGAGVDLPSVEAKLDGATLGGWLEALEAVQGERIELTFPRFELRSTLALITPLRQLGIRRVFTSQAELDRIAAERLTVSAVVHQAFVRVDEKGSEAAAATAELGRIKATLPDPAPEIRIDRPFLFAIVERAGNTVLFFGRCARP